MHTRVSSHIGILVALSPLAKRLLKLIVSVISVRFDGFIQPNSDAIGTRREFHKVFFNRDRKK